MFIAKQFTEVDCHPAREGERLPFPKLFRFSRDWWSWREGGKEICRKILAMVPGGRGGYKKPPGRGGGQAGADGVPRPQLKPQVAQVKALPSQHGSESAQNQGQLVLPQVSQGDFAAFQQMWGNPSFQQFGWQPSFPMQFMPQMVQGNQMQFQQGPFPVQQFPVQSLQQGGNASAGGKGVSRGS
jgi:hypothetical protein